jgi:membrane-associated HD superfamily phosphohydrolase
MSDLKQATKTVEKRLNQATNAAEKRLNQVTKAVEKKLNQATSVAQKGAESVDQIVNKVESLSLAVGRMPHAAPDLLNEFLEEKPDDSPVAKSMKDAIKKSVEEIERELPKEIAKAFFTGNHIKPAKKLYNILIRNTRKLAENVAEEELRKIVSEKIESKMPNIAGKETIVKVITKVVIDRVKSRK